MISLALIAAFACGSEANEPTESADDGFPSEEEAASLVATALASQQQSVANLEDSGKAITPPLPLPEFSLTNHDGQPFGSAELAGKQALISFAYTHCPDVCPALFGHFTHVQREMASRIGDDFELVIITVDPERDTVDWLNQRTTEMNGQWRFLTGSLEDVEEVWADFQVRVEKQGEFVGHTGVTYLVSPEGEMITRYPAYATFNHFISGIEAASISS